MQGIDILYWAISVVFCLGLLFAILLWCRSWRREEHDNNTRQLQLLAREVRRLRDVIESLDASVASIQTADEQFSQQLESLRNTVRLLKRGVPTASQTLERNAPQRRRKPAELDPIDSEDRYGQARSLLLSGRDPVEVARILDLGTAEVTMIARMLESSDATL